MAQGNVSVQNLNLGQGPVTEIERFFLFIGAADKYIDKPVLLNTQSDLDAELGEEESELKRQIVAARLNGGDRWACMALTPKKVASTPKKDGDEDQQDVWSTALDRAQSKGLEFEAVVITTHVTKSRELETMNKKAIELNQKYGRRVFFMAASKGIAIAEDKCWADYINEQTELTENLSAPRVLVVPQLHVNNLGVLAGRLANSSVSVADSPMRVATGALIGLGPVPVDNHSQALSSAVLTSLDAARLSVPQVYPDYPGTFWGDANMLDAPGSDYTVVENLRIVDKAARRVRILLIQMVADRRINSTPSSMASTKMRLMRPLREMSRSAQFAGLKFPGDIQPPKDDDIVLVWKTRTTIEAYLKLRPFNCPKDLIANIALDLSLDDEE